MDSESAPGVRRTDEAVLFNAGVRALSRFGFSDLVTHFGGKKSRRRWITAKSPEDNVISICSICHRQAHFAANRIQVESELMEATRRRTRERTGRKVDEVSE
jgi:hypothetical protein